MDRIWKQAAWRRLFLPAQKTDGEGMWTGQLLRAPPHRSGVTGEIPTHALLGLAQHSRLYNSGEARDDFDAGTIVSFQVSKNYPAALRIPGELQVGLQHRQRDL